MVQLNPFVLCGYFLGQPFLFYPTPCPEWQVAASAAAAGEWEASPGFLAESGRPASAYHEGRAPR